MGPLINMQKSVFLPLWNNYEFCGRKILYIESSSAIESENLVRTQNSSHERNTHAQLPRMKLKRGNILQLSDAVDILHVLSTSPYLYLK